MGSANNWPLKGGKHSNWQGGVRVNAFVSGGALPPAVRGTTSNELITVWDWYSTFVEGIAGGDPTDHRAAAAGLPPIDSFNHWYAGGRVLLWMTRTFLTKYPPTRLCRPACCPGTSSRAGLLCRRARTFRSGPAPTRLIRMRFVKRRATSRRLSTR